MEFRPATQEDLAYMVDHSISRGVQKGAPEDTNFVYAVSHEGITLSTGGFRLINHTTAWCWVDLSSESGKHIRLLYRAMRDWIEVFIKEHDLKRIQAYVECDFSEAITLVQHLGFKKESIMKQFVGDKDAFMYTRIL